MPLSTFEPELGGAGAVAMGLSHPWGQWPSGHHLQLRPLRCRGTEKQTGLRWLQVPGFLTVLACPVA